MDIEKLLTLPESKTLEFKRDSSSLKPLLKAVVAFANTSGGILIVGVDNTGSVKGVSDPLTVQDQLASSIAENIKPLLLPEIEIVTIKGAALIVIKIHHAAGPFYLKQNGIDPGVYVRLGATNRLASPEIISEIKRLKTNIHYDLLPCVTVKEDDLDVDLIKKIFNSHKHSIDTAKLLSLGILCNYSGCTVATNGGVILFGNDQVRQTYFPNARVSCARFAGTDKSEFIDRLELEGSILNAIQEVPKFIRRNTRMSAKIETMQRQDIA